MSAGRSSNNQSSSRESQQYRKALRNQCYYRPCSNEHSRSEERDSSIVLGNVGSLELVVNVIRGKSFVSDCREFEKSLKRLLAQFLYYSFFEKSIYDELYAKKATITHLGYILSPYAELDKVIKSVLGANKYCNTITYESSNLTYCKKAHCRPGATKFRLSDGRRTGNYRCAKNVPEARKKVKSKKSSLK